jgi:hypothetical protein
LTIHLLFVVAMAVVTTSGHANYFDRGTWRDVAIPLAPVLYPVALFGFPMMYVSPVIIVILLGQARSRGSRYAVAALVEFLLMLAHFYAVLPAIQ